jgi:hypothetical protein
MAEEIQCNDPAHATLQLRLDDALQDVEEQNKLIDELRAKFVPKPPDEKQPERGTGEPIAEVDMRLPISDPERMLKHHVRIETCLGELAQREKISMEAAYKWAGDMLEHFSNLTENEEQRQGGLRWGRIIIGLIILLLAGFALGHISRFVW